MIKVYPDLKCGTIIQCDFRNRNPVTKVFLSFWIKNFDVFLNIKSGLNNFVSKEIDGYQMMNLLDPDIPLDYLLPMSLPYSKSYQAGIYMHRQDFLTNKMTENVL